MSDDVRVKEEPVDFEECSPFELLNQIGQDDDVTRRNDDVTKQESDVTEWQDEQLVGVLGEEQPIIKLEYEGVVKTEITVGAEFDEDCSVVNQDLPVSCDYSGSRDVTCDLNTASDGLSCDPHIAGLNTELLSDQVPETSYPVSDTAGVDIGHNSDGNNLSMKMELPAKYKTLFDGVRAFPEMSKEILPIIEELVHFHNCICLLRRDLNLHRCEDCGRGFRTCQAMKCHARHCVIQKLENRFAPANITKHIGPPASTEPVETETTPSTPTPSETESKTSETERNADILPDGDVTPTRPKRSRREETDPDYVPAGQVKIKKESTGNLNFRVTTDPVTGEMTIDKQQSPSEGKRKRTRRTKEGREFEKGTCWGIPNKSESCRITRVVEHNQFSHKKINPYHLFRYSGEVLYHTAIPLPLNYQGTAQNVFNTMISSIVEVGKLVPITKGRKKYSQILQKEKRIPPPDLELLPTPQQKPSSSKSTPPRKKNIIVRVGKTNQKSIVQSTLLAAPEDRPAFKKIKIVCEPTTSCSKNRTTPLILQKKSSGSLYNYPEPRENPKCNRAFGIGSRRTKTAGFGTPQPVTKKQIKPGKTFAIGFGNIKFSKGKTLVEANASGVPGELYSGKQVVRDPPSSKQTSSHFDIATLDNSPSGLLNKDATRDFLVEKLKGYLEEDDCQERYVLEEHTLLFLENFVLGAFINSPGVRNRIEKILKGIQDTIPDDPAKREAIKSARSRLADVIDLEDYPRKYGLENDVVLFMESFAFGVANPCQKDIEKAEEILKLIEVKKLRKTLVNLTTIHATIVHTFDIPTRIFIDNFVSRVRPDTVPPADMIRLKAIIDKLQSGNTVQRSDTDNIECASSKDSSTKNKELEKVLSTDSINESDLSSPEIMRSCNENTLSMPSPDLPSDNSFDLKCIEEISPTKDQNSVTDEEANSACDDSVKECDDASGSFEVHQQLKKVLTKDGRSKNTTDGKPYRIPLDNRFSYVTDFIHFCSVFVGHIKNLMSDLCSCQPLYKDWIFAGQESFEMVLNEIYRHPIIVMIPAMDLCHRLWKVAINSRGRQPQLMSRVRKFIEIEELHALLNHRPCRASSSNEDIALSFTSLSKHAERFYEDFILEKHDNLFYYVRSCVMPQISLITRMSHRTSLHTFLSFNSKKSNSGARLSIIKKILMILERNGFDLNPVFLSNEQCKKTIDSQYTISEFSKTEKGANETPTTYRLDNGHVDVSTPVSIKHLTSLRKHIKSSLIDVAFIEKINLQQRIFLKDFVNFKLSNLDDEKQYHHVMDILLQVFDKTDSEKKKQNGKAAQKTVTQSEKVLEVEETISLATADEQKQKPSQPTMAVDDQTQESEPPPTYKKTPESRPPASVNKHSDESGPLVTANEQKQQYVIVGNNRSSVVNKLDPRTGFIVKRLIVSVEPGDKKADKKSITSEGKPDDKNVNILLHDDAGHNINDGYEMFDFPTPTSDCPLDQNNLQQGRQNRLVGSPCDLVSVSWNDGRQPRDVICDRGQISLMLHPHSNFPILDICKNHFSYLSGAFDRKSRKSVVLNQYLNTKVTEAIDTFDAQSKMVKTSTGTQTTVSMDGFEAALTEAEQTELEVHQTETEINTESKSADSESTVKYLLSENRKAKEKLQQMKQTNKLLEQKLKDMELQLQMGKDLRAALKEESTKWQEALKQQTIKSNQTNKLEEQLSEYKKRYIVASAELATCKSSDDKQTIAKLQAEIEELRARNNEIQSTNTELFHNLHKRNENVKSLEVSIQSISEALRLQTKTISTLSRKHSGNVVEDHNSKVLGGYESLLTITCKVLGEQQALSKEKIEDPAKMREICESVAGEENLFSIFMRVFCGNSVCANPEEAEAIEKRVLFLINLMSYFYNGATDEGEEEGPSSSSLSTLL